MTKGSEFESRWLQEFSVLHVVHSYPMDAGAISPGIKRLGCKADHSPATSSEVKKMCIYTSTPLYVFTA
jgi:hypothetical protein